MVGGREIEAEDEELEEFEDPLRRYNALLRVVEMIVNRNEGGSMGVHPTWHFKTLAKLRFSKEPLVVRIGP